MTGEGTGDGVEATAPPVMLTLIVRNSERGRAQRSGEMVIIGRDGGESRPWGERGIRPRRSGGRRPHTMVGRTRAGDWRTGPPLPICHYP